MPIAHILNGGDEEALRKEISSILPPIVAFYNGGDGEALRKEFSSILLGPVGGTLWRPLVVTM